MNKFRKLTNVTIYAVVIVLGLNFSGLFYISVKSEENEERENLEKLSESQQKISLRLTQDLLVFINGIKDHQEGARLGEDFPGLLQQFKEQHSKIEQEIPAQSFSGPELKAVFDQTAPYYATTAGIASELLENKSYGVISQDNLIRILSDNQLQYLKKMELVVQNIRDSEVKLERKIFWINLLILGSLIISLVILGLMVISPVLKQGIKNYSALQVSLNDVMRSEEALRKKDLLLQGVAFATEELISNDDLQVGIGEAIKRFGITMQADEVNIHKNQVGENRELFSNQLVCYKSNTEELKYRDPEFKHIPFDYMPWSVEALCEEGIFYSAVADLKESSRIWFESKNVLSIVSIPVFASDNFWGFINIYDCKEVRNWQETEVSILRSLATTLGSVIERKGLEKRLTEAKELAEASSTAKSEFMSNMSHELRTPMNGIIGFTDLVLTTELNAHQREYLTNVSKSGHNLLNIINDILDFSKIEANKILIDPTPFKLNELVEETADMLSLRAVEKGLEIVCIVDPSLPSQFMGDAARIRQILTNLVGNAIKFTKQGEITIHVRNNGDIYSKDNSRYLDVSIAVKDTGIGIPAEKMQAVFENFTQVDSSTTRKYGGTGLGLTISRGLAHLMSGTVDVQSEIGKGSTFTLELPLEVLNEMPDVIFEARPSLNKVLIIDDNATNCSLMEGIFKHLEISCTICFSGPEALEVLEKSRLKGEIYDLIITDHQMPEMDGITLVKKIREQSGEDCYPFILMLSSLDKSLFQLEAEKCGIDKFLSKPVKISQLRDIISKLFGQSLSAASRALKKPKIEQVNSGAEVMVVEDEPINMLLISAVLRKMGVKVIESGSGSHAMEMLAVHSPGLIFMDVNMPEIDGLNVTRMIRKLEGPKSAIPIIALTADAMKEDRQRCLDAGMNDYVSKPFRFEEISNVLNKYFDMNRLRA